MTYNKQRESECVLASLCSIASVDYETTSDNFEAYFGGPWYAEVNQVEDYTKRSDVLAWIQRHLKLDIPWQGVLCVRIGDAPMAGKHDLRGRGQLSILNRTLRYCHSVAFEDGLIFDSDKPATEAGLPFDDWIKLWPGCELVRINRLVNGKIIVGEAL